MPERPPLREPSEDVKEAVLRRDGRRCCCCGSSCGLQIDHIVPYYLGGSCDFDQLQTLCRFCNAEKAINELSFRVSRSPLQGPPAFLPLAIPLADDRSSEETWKQHIQRTINFFYQCAATESVQFLADPCVCEIRLRPGIDTTWIEPHLANITMRLREERAAAELPPVGPFKVTVLK